MVSLSDALGRGSDHRVPTVPDHMTQFGVRKRCSVSGQARLQPSERSRSRREGDGERRDECVK